MFCPIFLPTIPAYIRPVISWVVTVRAYCASSLTLLHQPTEATGEGETQGERKTLSYFSMPERHEASVWREEEGGSTSGRRGGVGGAWSEQVIRYIVSGAAFESLLHKTLSRFSASTKCLRDEKTHANGGKTCKSTIHGHLTAPPQGSMTLTVCTKFDLFSS